MRILRAATMLLLLAGPAYAQNLPDINIIPEAKSKTPEEIEQDKIKDKAYRDSLRKIPDAKGSSDPWGTVRGAEAPKTATPAKPKKTGTTVN